MKRLSLAGGRDRVRLPAAFVLLALAPCQASSRTGSPGAEPSLALTPRPRLVLFVSVDQMRFDYLTRLDGQFQGGLRRLLDRGAVFTNARYRHASTETGPGHAVLASGRNGSHSGIVGNDWWDALSRTMVNVVDDPAQSPVGGTGRAASPANFIGFTIGDILKRSSPRSRVVSVALKDRSAVLMGGRRPDAAFWFDNTAGGFVSSTYYMTALPRWLAAWQESRPADRFQGRSWTRLLADVSVYERLAGPDQQAGEWDGAGVAFPHALTGRPPQDAFYASLRRTPFADELLLEMGKRALEAYGLGRRPGTDMLFVGFSSVDGVGHDYGPDSQEAMDCLLRLDRMLQQLFEAADRASGGRTLVVLSADHGSMPLVELLQARGIAARRVRGRVLQEAVEKELKARFSGRSGLIARFDAPHFYLDLDAMRGQGLSRAEVEAAVADGARASGIVERVYTQAALLGDPPAGDPDFALFRSAFFEPRSPHLIVRLAPYVLLDEDAQGTGHGSPHDYDRHVPVVFMGAGLRPGRYAEPSGPEDIAPTLGALLGLDYPLQDAGRRLGEMVER
jgi:predicted AlkP superfamily pyrophosphatase or phosphodiesterase